MSDIRRYYYTPYGMTSNTWELDLGSSAYVKKIDHLNAMVKASIELGLAVKDNEQKEEEINHLHKLVAAYIFEAVKATEEINALKEEIKNLIDEERKELNQAWLGSNTIN